MRLRINWGDAFWVWPWKEEEWSTKMGELSALDNVEFVPLSRKSAWLLFSLRKVEENQDLSSLKQFVLKDITGFTGKAELGVIHLTMKVIGLLVNLWELNDEEEGPALGYAGGYERMIWKQKTDRYDLNQSWRVWEMPIEEGGLEWEMWVRHSDQGEWGWRVNRSVLQGKDHLSV